VGFVSELPWPTEQPGFTDGVVSVRRWELNDAPWVYKACQEEAVQRWTHITVPYRIEDAEGFVGVYAPHQWDSRQGAAFAIIDANSGVGVGSVGLMVRDSRSRVGEVGYWLNYTASGRGLTSRALELLSSWALSDGQMVRLELLIETENTASRKVAERTGYSLEGVMRQKVFHRGAQRDVAMYARTL
jgi:RimJ/RimL family protein N-acetyltransferase